MIVMLIVHVPVLVLDFFVLVLMVVPLGQVQPYAQCHQRCGNRQNNDRADESDNRECAEWERGRRATGRAGDAGFAQERQQLPSFLLRLGLSSP